VGGGGGGGKQNHCSSNRSSIAFGVWFEVQKYWGSWKNLTGIDIVYHEKPEKTSLRFWMGVNEASIKLNKICSTEELAFNLCISLNHFMVLENTEIETSHFRNVRIIESLPEQRLQWSSVAILHFFSSFLIMIILCNILNKNCLGLLSLVIWYILIKLLLQSRKLFGKFSFHFFIPLGSDTEHSLNS